MKKLKELILKQAYHIDKYWIIDGLKQFNLYYGGGKVKEISFQILAQDIIKNVWGTITPAKVKKISQYFKKIYEKNNNKFPNNMNIDALMKIASK